MFSTHRRNVVSLASGVDSPNARHEYLSYILSLMRSHHDEHADALPKLDVASLRHVAYVLDSFVYYVRSKEQSGDAELAKKEVEQNTDHSNMLETATATKTTTTTTTPPATTESIPKKDVEMKDAGDEGTLKDGATTQDDPDVARKAALQALEASIIKDATR